MFRNKKNLFIVFLIPVVFFLYALYTIGDYGINWDEPYHFRRGQAFLQLFLTGQKNYNGIPKYPPLKGSPDTPGFRNSDQIFQDVQKNPSLSDPSFRRSYYQNDAWNGEYHIDIEDPSGHPVLNDILAAAFNKIFYQKLGIFGDLESYHLFEITMASLLVFAVAFFMWKEFGVIESVISSLILSTYPLFLGEQHFNIKDPIIASFYALTLITFYLFVKKQKYLWAILSIIFFALGLSTKFNIVFISIPIFVWLVLYFYRNLNFSKFIKKFWPLIIVLPLLVFAVFIGSFPTLWKNPLWGIKRVVDYYLVSGYSSLSQPSNYYLFNFLNTYPSIWIFYTTPVVTLCLFFSSIFFIKKLFKNKTFSLLLSLSLFTIIGRISLFGALSYGGVRLVMEYIPILAMLCGITAGLIYKKLKGLKIYIFLFVITLLFIPTIFKLISIHPNENVFFNWFAGGLKGAKEKQINSWGNSNGNAYFPALLWLNKNAEENARLTLPVGSISNIPRYKLRPDVSLSADYWSGPAHEGEYVLELTYDYPPMQWYSLKYLNTVMKPIYEVKVDGVAIAKLWKNSPEFIIQEFKNEKEIIASVNPNEKDGILEITLPQSENIMRLDLKQPTGNCTVLYTGYLDTSIDGKVWTREVEDIARDQLKQARLKTLESDFTFYFVAREAKYIRLHTENLDSCILKASSPKISVLDNKTSNFH